MKNIIFLFIAVSLFSCKDKDKDPVVPNDGYTRGKVIEITFNSEIPVGGKFYIDTIVLTANTFTEATGNVDRFDYENRLVSTTDIWLNGSQISVNTLSSRCEYAGRSFVAWFSKHVYWTSPTIGETYYGVMPSVAGKTPYVTIRLTSRNSNPIRVKTENFPVSITVIN